VTGQRDRAALARAQRPGEVLVVGGDKEDIEVIGVVAHVLKPLG
jgi:hypothetical protein